jgi:tetratricopeptide (TPR) repeat protein
MVSPVSRRDFKAARRLYELGKLSDAERIYRRILKATPEDSLAMHNLAVIQFQNGNVYTAIQTLREAVSKDPDHPDYFVTMAEMLAHPDFQGYLNAPFLGPFNGQLQRQAMFRELAAAIQPHTIFETGTYRGTTADFMASNSAAHVFTCELHANFFRFCAARFRDAPNITVVHLDSRSFVRQYVPRFAGAETSLFYLDAHWHADDLPLLEELRLVFEYAPRAVILIDDFQVWDDPGYSYDDYGAARRLTLDYLSPLGSFGPRYFFPLGSAQETGMRRGCVVLTIDPELAERIASLAYLRPAFAPPVPALSTQR